MNKGGSFLLESFPALKHYIGTLIIVHKFFRTYVVGRQKYINAAKVIAFVKECLN